MIAFYFKQAYKNLRKSKLITIGSVLTLFTGVLSISLLAVYVYNELSMDKFHERRNDIYMTVVQASPQSNWEAIDCSLFFDFDYQKYPELESGTSIQKYEEGELKFFHNNIEYSPEGIITDTNFFSVFEFKLKIGDLNTLKADKKTIFLTESFAKKIFGDSDPIDQPISIIAGFKNEYTVGGILADVPTNSSICFDFVVFNERNNRSGYSRSGANFILAGSGFKKDEFLKKIETIGREHPQFKLSNISLRALPEIYFGGEQAEFNKIYSRSGDKNNIKVLFLIIGLILFVSILNFSNLQIVNINTSIKNIGINKISGARGIHLLSLKFIEFLLITVLCAVIITFAFVLIIPQFNNFIGIQLAPSFLQILLLNISVIALIIGLAMIYPSAIISKLPVKLSLKNQLQSNNSLIGRQVIIILQFTLAISLLISSAVVIKQLQMMLHKDLGFHSQNIIKTKLFERLPFPNYFREDMNDRNQELINDYNEKKAKQSENYQFVKNELTSFSSIESFSQNQSPIESYKMPWKNDHENNEYTSQYTLSINPNHQSVFDFKIVEGRFFDAQKDKQRGNRVLINEAAKKLWKIGDISRARLNNNYWQEDDGYEIIGVVKNFDFLHLSMKPQPLVMVYFEDIDGNFLIRFAEGATQSGLEFVKQLNEKINPEKPFEYTFVSDEISALYDKEKRLSQIYIIFTLIAFLISMNGLFIIALYDTAKKIKEIGVRKVNGSTIKEVIYLLNWGFMKWVFISYFIATPISYFAMQKWLQNFAYKTELSWWVFALAGLLALGVSLLTVSWQSWRAASRNPVEALRYE